MNSIEEYYNRYDEDGRLLRKNRLPEYLITMEYMRFLHSICEREDLTGFSIHMLDIFKKL